MPYKEFPCTVCGAPGNEPCVSVRKPHKPLKNFHDGGRVLTIPAVPASEVIDILKNYSGPIVIGLI